jgi:sugar fermentation stimulation protein A
VTVGGLGPRAAGRSSRARARLEREASLPARFVRRYKRFFADVETDDGRTLTVHCPDPGSMRGFLRPGAAVRCSTSDDPKRRLRHSLEMMRAGRVWVGLHPARANAVVDLALAAGIPRDLAGYATREREVAPARGARSRLDFRLSDRSRDRRPAWLEVKSVTLAEGATARFPDSVTERGRRHLEVLTDLRRRGARAALLFLVQRADCDRVVPADDIDPAYGEALRHAAELGVEVFALGARVTARAITVERELAVCL